MMARKRVGKVGNQSRSFRHPIRVGLTGSLASGKSTSLKAFKKLGWKVLSADELVAEIYKEKGITKAEVLKKFGQSKAGLKKLEKWIHPLVAKKILSSLKKSRKPAVVEVPLLFEAKFEKYFDLCVFVFAPYEDRVKRAFKRGMDLKLFDFLDRQQFAPEKKARLSDFVVFNDSKKSLKTQIRFLSEIILAE